MTHTEDQNMNTIHLTAQLTQLLDRGYSIDDVRNLVTVPHEVLEQAIQEHRLREHGRRHDRLLQGQAEFAMRLGRR
jgi:DNA-binding transcriptional MerR regulator